MHGEYPTTVPEPCTGTHECAAGDLATPSYLTWNTGRSARRKECLRGRTRRQSAPSPPTPARTTGPGPRPMSLAVGRAPAETARSRSPRVLRGPGLGGVTRLPAGARASFFHHTAPSRVLAGRPALDERATLPYTRCLTALCHSLRARPGSQAPIPPEEQHSTGPWPSALEYAFICRLPNRLS